MYFDFEDSHPDIDRLGGAISRREGILLSIIGHMAFVMLLLLGPSLPIVKQALEREAERQAELVRQQELLQAEQQRQARRFVFVAPRIDTDALRPPPPTADLSDKDRVARAPERSPAPTNPLPFARGNSPEMVEAEPPEVARGRGPAPTPAPGRERGRGASDTGADEGQSGLLRGQGPLPAPAPEESSGIGARAGDRGLGETPGGSLGEALKNLERFAAQQTFGNEGGSAGEFGPSIQFDTKGVEFGPWIRRFIAQIKRNWLIPYAAMALKGHVVLTFNVHKDGAITDLTVRRPSSVDAFTNAAYNALATSNPTQPLPPEYPADRAFFTVTFYYNESPSSP